MNPIYPSTIESVLLYQNYKPANPDDILLFLNESFKTQGLEFTRGAGTGAVDDFMLFAAGDIIVLITQSSKPLGVEGFESALASPFRQMTFPGGDKKVKNHKSHIFITVSKDMPLPGIEAMIEKLGQDPRKKFEPKEFLQALSVCTKLTNYFAGKNKPEAVHWLQSNQICSTDYFMNFAKEEFPLPLYIHPNLYSTGKADTKEHRAVGFRTTGAANFIGQEILFHETTVPFEWCLQMCFGFIGMALQSGKLIPNGETFGATPEDKIKVIHKAPDEQDPDGLIELTVLTAKEFNYERVE